MRDKLIHEKHRCADNAKKPDYRPIPYGGDSGKDGLIKLKAIEVWGPGGELVDIDCRKQTNIQFLKEKFINAAAQEMRSVAKTAVFKVGDFKFTFGDKRFQTFCRLNRLTGKSRAERQSLWKETKRLAEGRFEIVTKRLLNGTVHEVFSWGGPIDYKEVEFAIKFPWKPLLEPTKAVPEGFRLTFVFANGA
jgi:hypothetical protein